MKNQNDMIFSIVAVVLALIVAGVLFATQPEVPAQVAVAPITTTPAALPGADVVMANNLPGAGAGAAGGLGAAGTGAGAGAPGSDAPMAVGVTGAGGSSGGPAAMAKGARR